MAYEDSLLSGHSLFILEQGTYWQPSIHPCPLYLKQGNGTWRVCRSEEEFITLLWDVEQ